MTDREGEEDDLAPIVPAATRRPSKRAGSSSSLPPYLAGSASGSGSGRKGILKSSSGGNKVADEELVSQSRRSVSDSGMLHSKPHGTTFSTQFSRHAGAGSGSLSSTRKDDSSGVSGSGSEGSHKARKTLAPSSAQKKKAAMTSGASKPSAKDYVASRVWKNESTLTFGMRVKLAEQPFMWADAAFAATNIVDVWEHYDGNKNDVLDRSEVSLLASDLVERFVSLYTEQLLRDQPSLSDNDVQRMLRRDIWPHMLPGENLAECKKLLAERLYRELDVDSDGQITKMEFMFQWKNTSKQWLTLKPPRGGLGCVIL